jgi:hypothetical protein
LVNRLPQVEFDAARFDSGRFNLHQHVNQGEPPLTLVVLVHGLGGRGYKSASVNLSARRGPCGLGRGRPCRDEFGPGRESVLVTVVGRTLLPGERARLADGRGPASAAAVIDSQTVRAAGTVPAASSGYDGGKKIKGRKRHVADGTSGLLLAVVVTAASVQDRDGAFRITAALRQASSTITLVWADAGYTGPVRPRRAQDRRPGRGDRQAPRPGQGLRPAPPPLGRGTLLRLADQIPPPHTPRRDPPSHPRSHDLHRRHLAAQQPPHPLTQFTDAL